MFKRAGVLAFVLTAGALLQPAAASAQERFDRGNDRGVEMHRAQPRFTRDYREPERRDDWNRDRFVREDRDFSFRRDDRVVVVRPDSDYRYTRNAYRR